MAAFACNGTSSLAVPTGTHAATIALPLCGGKAKSLTVDGKTVASLEHGDDSLLVHNLGPGSHAFAITFATEPADAAAPPQAAPQPTYRDRFVAVDSNQNLAADMLREDRWRMRIGRDLRGESVPTLNAINLLEALLCIVDEKERVISEAIPPDFFFPIVHGVGIEIHGVANPSFIFRSRQAPNIVLHA